MLRQQIFPTQPRISAATALAGMMVNGLARSGWNAQIQGNVRTRGLNGSNGLDGNYWLSGEGDVFDVNPDQSKRWVRLRVDSQLEGYAYNTLSVPPRIAITILTIYCVYALTHLFYAGISGTYRTSYCLLTHNVELPSSRD